jgi:phosphatidylglycerol:prolipoprotein diacylglycerol transferase
LLGQIIGRFGNFFNYEAFGYPTNLPWKMFVPESFRPEEFLQNSFFHPWFLYEILANLFILFLILRFDKLGRSDFLAAELDPPTAGLKQSSLQKSTRPTFQKFREGILKTLFNNLFFTYLLLYNAVRACLEFLRIDSTFIGSFRLNFLVSVSLVLVCLVILFKNSFGQTHKT